MGRRVLRHRRQPVRLLHARASSCGSPGWPAKGADRPTPPRWSGRCSPTCAAAPAGGRSSTPGGRRCPAPSGADGDARRAAERDLEAAAGGRRSRAGHPQRVGAGGGARARRLRRRHRARRRAGRRARRPAAGGPSARRWPRPGPRPARCRAAARPPRSTPPLACPTATGRRPCARRGSSPPTSRPTRRGARPAASRRRPLANGGAFGGKVASPVAGGRPRALADEHGRPVRVLLSREDAVRLGPKRPPIAAGMRRRRVRRACGWRARRASPTPSPPWPRASRSRRSTSPGPPTSVDVRAAGWAEALALLAAAGATTAGTDGAGVLDAAMVDGRAPGSRCGRRTARWRPPPCARRTTVRVSVRWRAATRSTRSSLRSYCIGAAHMALGWVTSEGLAVDDGRRGARPDDPLLRRRPGGRHARRSRSTVVSRRRRPASLPVNGSDAVFAAVAAAVWLAQGRRRLADACARLPDTGRHGRPTRGGHDRMTKPVGPYTPIVRAGDWVIVSGQIGLVDGELVERGLRRRAAPGDRQPRGPAGRGRDAGRRREDDGVPAPHERLPLMNELYVEAFGDHRPARSAFGVAELPFGALVEIEAWAFVGARADGAMIGSVIGSPDHVVILVVVIPVAVIMSARSWPRSPRLVAEGRPSSPTTRAASWSSSNG